MHIPIPVIDLFAGPGGLGEGFASVVDSRGQRVFQIGVSVEKDPSAHRTLRLRSMFRLLRETGRLGPYFDYIRGYIGLEDFLRYPPAKRAFDEASVEARCAELGQTDPTIVDSWIKVAISGSPRWVLIGGPPCQAYSLAGRSRRRNDASFATDEKHFLYREYLRIIATHSPTVFVMENVKGLLSSKHDGTPIFQRILEDLARPNGELIYDIRSFVVEDGSLGIPGLSDLSAPDYVIEAERFGVPQKRHRVILLGVLRERSDVRHPVLAPKPEVDLLSVIGGMPRIRSRLSGADDDFWSWRRIVTASVHKLVGWRNPLRERIEERMRNLSPQLIPRSVGSAFVPSRQPVAEGHELLKWLHEPELGGFVQHESRSHMAEDLQRYHFAACYAKVTRESPKIRDFPDKLLPKHRNVVDSSIPFEDRFRVQLGFCPSTTVVSHIAKDGHYYIHPDPAQCRSLTVREAARLQTFPDNYFFEGNRTQQYTQVGNAVPPFLARQLGQAVAELLDREASAQQRRGRRVSAG